MYCVFSFRTQPVSNTLLICMYVVYSMSQEVCGEGSVRLGRRVVGVGFAATCSLAVVDSRGLPVTASPSRGELVAGRTACMISHAGSTHKHRG